MYRTSQIIYPAERWGEGKCKQRSWKWKKKLILFKPSVFFLRSVLKESWYRSEREYSSITVWIMIPQKAKEELLNNIQNNNVIFNIILLIS